jgi:hypothetical protein
LLDCIDLRLGISCTLNEWRFLFRSHYDALRPFLSLTGEQSLAWCCPVNGRKQKLIGENGGRKPLSSACKCYPCVEADSIPSEDLEMWTFCPSRFANHLSPGLGLHAAPKWIKKGVLRLGSLSYRSTSLPAFLLNYTDTSYQLHAQTIAAGQTGICIFYTPRYCPDTAEWLRQRQHGYFSLEDLLLPGSLDPSPTYWQELQKFKSTLPHSPYRPNLEVFIAPDFKRINYPDGYVLNLAKAHKRRAVLRFIHEQVVQSGKDEFDVEVMREEYNKQYPDKPWNSDRFKEDLFRGAAADFDRIFETVDAPLGRYRIKL